jgi:hypothetical protein
MVSGWIVVISEDRKATDRETEKRFSLQIDKATDFSGVSHLMAYLWCS